MAPPLPSLYSLSFFLALCATLFVSATLRLLAILPNRQSQAKTLRKRPLATRVLIVLGSGGHTHEMFYLLRDLDTKKYTHRTYVVSSGDAFSAQRAAEFEKQLESREKLREQEDQRNTPQVTITNPDGIIARKRAASLSAPRQICVGPEHYTIATIPRARKIHQSLLTTPLSCLSTLLSALGTLLPLSRPPQPTVDVYEAAAFDLPDLIITNGPATAVIVVLASYILRFFNVRSAHSRGKCKTIYVESFARVKTLSLSGRILVRLVDRFLVQWESLEGKGGRAEYWGVLV